MTGRAGPGGGHDIIPPRENGAPHDGHQDHHPPEGRPARRRRPGLRRTRTLRQQHLAYGQVGRSVILDRTGNRVTAATSALVVN
jgi:hypothetical protein